MKAERALGIILVSGQVKALTTFGSPNVVQSSWSKLNLFQSDHILPTNADASRFVSACAPPAAQQPRRNDRSDAFDGLAQPSSPSERERKFP